LDEDSFLLPSAFADQTLESISITSNGYGAILLGATVTGGSDLTSTPEPSSVALFASSAFVGLAFLRRRSRSRKTA
jgi:PEP-CTERM motif